MENEDIRIYKNSDVSRVKSNYRTMPTGRQATSQATTPMAMAATMAPPNR
jgi:hypothetical protein